MEKKWYPVVDITACIECGACIATCHNDVYDIDNGTTPKIVNADLCSYHCFNCGELCPVGAITYVGDDTGWIPPVLRTDEMRKEPPKCCCCGGK